MYSGEKVSLEMNHYCSKDSVFKAHFSQKMSIVPNESKGECWCIKAQTKKKCLAIHSRLTCSSKIIPDFRLLFFNLNVSVNIEVSRDNFCVDCHDVLLENNYKCGRSNVWNPNYAKSPCYGEEKNNYFHEVQLWCFTTFV